MNYEQARPLLKSGDLLAWSHTGWGSWHDIKVQLVRMFTRSEYSHVAVAWVTAGRVFALEAVQPMVRIYPLSKLGDFYHIPLVVNWTPEVEEYALSHVGTPYSQVKAIKAFFQPLLHDGQTECAEYVSDVVVAAGAFVGAVATPTAVVRHAQWQGAPCTLITNLPIQKAPHERRTPAS